MKDSFSFSTTGGGMRLKRPLRMGLEVEPGLKL